MVGDIQMIIRLALAALLGAVIGFERGYYGKAAGFRTHSLVATGAALFMLVSIFVANTYGVRGSSDPSRIAAQVVSGIGFLGAGTIIRYGATIKGLTTAASLWAVAGIGMACGAGEYKGAILATVIIFMILLAFSKIEPEAIKKRKKEKEKE